jgi:hypothetical protein
MRTWMDELTTDELEVMRQTLNSSIENNELYGHTKQHAKMLLNEVDDHLWNRVCLGSPSHSDQLGTELQ